LKVVTANRLIDGEVVWLGPSGKWVDLLGEARLIETPAAEAEALAAAEASAARQEVVDPYAIDVIREEGRIVPQRLREMIRAAGPTTRTDLGKQARRAIGAA